MCVWAPGGLGWMGLGRNAESLQVRRAWSNAAPFTCLHVNAGGCCASQHVSLVWGRVCSWASCAVCCPGAPTGVPDTTPPAPMLGSVASVVLWGPGGRGGGSSSFSVGAAGAYVHSAGSCVASGHNECVHHMINTGNTRARAHTHTHTHTHTHRA